MLSCLISGNTLVETETPRILGEIEETPRRPYHALPFTVSVVHLLILEEGEASEKKNVKRAKTRRFYLRKVIRKSYASDRN